MLYPRVDNYPYTLALPIKVRAIPIKCSFSDFAEKNYPTCQLIICLKEKNNTQINNATEFMIEAWKHWCSENYMACMMHVGVAAELFFAKLATNLEDKKSVKFTKLENRSIGYYRRKFFPLPEDKPLKSKEELYSIEEKFDMLWKGGSSNLKNLVDKRNGCFHREERVKKDECAETLVTALLLNKYIDLAILKAAR